MITNTDLFYTKAKQFQDRRTEIVEEYENKARMLEKFKGSAGYDMEMQELTKAKNGKIKAIQEEYRPIFQAIFSGMMDAIGRRSMKAPTNEQVNLLNMLKMKRRVTAEEVERVAAAVKDNPIAISVLQDIAVDHNLPGSLAGISDEMTSEKAATVVSEMLSGMEDYLMYDTTRASRMAKEYHEAHYGESRAKLTKRALFSNKSECFYEFTGMDSASLAQFSSIVDGQEGAHDQ